MWGYQYHEKQIAGTLRLDLAQYREMAAFAQFGSADLDKATRAQIDRGLRSTEILKQPQHTPQSLEKEITTLYAVTNGYLDDIPVGKVADFEQALDNFLQTSHPEIGRDIATTKDLGTETEEKLKAAITDFKESWALQPGVGS